MESLGDLAGIPLPGDRPQILGALASFERGSGLAVVSHYDVQPVIDLLRLGAGTRPGRRVARDLNRIVDEIAADAAARHAPDGPRADRDDDARRSRGCWRDWRSPILLVYLLIVVNFQSWTDPFIIISALAGGAGGDRLDAVPTGTTLSVPALTGAIMCVGVATANSILVVSFAKDELATGRRRRRCGRCGGLRAVPAGAHDRAGDDHRHGADGAGAR